MTEHAQILKAFVKLGDFLTEFCENGNNAAFETLNRAIRLAEEQNGWFTKENILFALRQWGEALGEPPLKNWLSQYGISQKSSQKTIAIIMAGNIPLVGFHDFLSVLLTGNKALCKLSSNDTTLVPVLADYLIDQEPSLNERIEFTEGKIQGFDAIIATGSNNTARYFEYYFKQYPHIIRKNRTSVAVLTGDEKPEDLKALGDDIFRYFGLGCRNVSKIFVPKGYEFDTFFNGIFDHKKVIEHHKYANNYDYNKAVYLMSAFKILDNGFLVLKEDDTLHSPIAVLFYEYYSDLKELHQKLNAKRGELQCIVGRTGIMGEVAFGHTQRPKLNDYADGVDTLDFLLRL